MRPIYRAFIDLTPVLCYFCEARVAAILYYPVPLASSPFLEHICTVSACVLYVRFLRYIARASFLVTEEDDDDDDDCVCYYGSCVMSRIGGFLLRFFFFKVIRKMGVYYRFQLHLVGRCMCDIIRGGTTVSSLRTYIIDSLYIYRCDKYIEACERSLSTCWIIELSFLYICMCEKIIGIK